MENVPPPAAVVSHPPDDRAALLEAIRNAQPGHTLKHVVPSTTARAQTEDRRDALAARLMAAVANRRAAMGPAVSAAGDSDDEDDWGD